jgi:hypothetical protein
MSEVKWKLVGGRIYRLADIFDDLADAVSLARKLKEQNHVFLSRITNNRWAVYWRTRSPAVECESKYFSVAP